MMWSITIYKLRQVIEVLFYVTDVILYRFIRQFQIRNII